MGLTIGVRFIEGGKSKRAVIISEIKGRNVYPSETTKFKTNRRLKRGWCHRIQDRRVICRGQNRRWQPMSKNPPQVQDRERGKDQ